ncbi:hypothetical protein BC6307_14960 [Sutcliffiella cohnii]|uniref:Uncharacterized protein n=1 Tax=Sutcliffiella cohnii TaxID=33932 RepID=A0A223KSQ9_9BACI|nr:hypothetical protein [Sutcliffiella cohnii]AST92499.1 hypothetical protein BC6307_14960 [Sutcliffiella cohnii]
MKKLFCIIIVIMVALIGCGTEKETRSSTLDDYEVTNINAEIMEGDFVYRLYSKERVYEPNEEIQVYGEIEYVGEEEEVVIYHAASPFYFIITEEVRGYEIDYAMDTPLIGTTLKRGEPLVEPYRKSGGYSDQSEKEFVEFIKEFLHKEGFPSGFYTINGFTDFYVEKGNHIKEEYEMEAQINIKVSN